MKLSGQIVIYVAPPPPSIPRKFQLPSKIWPFFIQFIIIYYISPTPYYPVGTQSGLHCSPFLHFIFIIALWDRARLNVCDWPKINLDRRGIKTWVSQLLVWCPNHCTLTTQKPFASKVTASTYYIRFLLPLTDIKDCHWVNQCALLLASWITCNGVIQIFALSCWLHTASQVVTCCSWQHWRANYSLSH